MQLSTRLLRNNAQILARLDMIENEVASGQVKDFFSTQSVPEPTSSILQHIHFHEVNKFNTLRSNEQIDNHIDMSIHSIEMSFESTPLYHLNRIEELEYQKPVEKVVSVQT